MLMADLTSCGRKATPLRVCGVCGRNKPLLAGQTGAAALLLTREVSHKVWRNGT
jgi:hypothetical protein